MKRVITGVVAGIVIGSTGVGVAASSWSKHAYGVWCKSDPSVRGIACVKEDGSGYGVGVSEDFVTVVSNKGKVILVRYH